jgi:Lon protease-like protein
MNPGNLWLVSIEGVIRFKINAYVETDKPYHMAHIRNYEDNDKFHPKYREVLSEMRHQLKRYDRLFRQPKGLPPNDVSIFDNQHLYIWTFFWWRFLPLKDDHRIAVLELRHAGGRLHAFNEQFKKMLDWYESQPQNRRGN